MLRGSFKLKVDLESQAGFLYIIPTSTENYIKRFKINVYSGKMLKFKCVRTKEKKDAIVWRERTV